MTTASETTAPVPESWPALNMLERRVLGVLVEKSKTTPDVYPMSLNALVVGCNQKQNRDPILNLSEIEVEEALDSAKKKGLALMITGGRVTRWRQLLYEAWKVSKVELAILAELLLRGPQTEGELRTRATRMEPIDDLDALRALLRPLAERQLVVYLTPEGRRGTMLTHGFHAADELERLRARHGGAVDEPLAEASRSPAAPALEARLAAAETTVAALHDQLSALQQSVTGLADEVRKLKEGLGLPL